VLVYGVSPRRAAPVAYAIVVWSFLIEIIAATVKLNRWVLDTSVLHHVRPVPAANADWASAAAVAGLGLLAAVVGIACFGRRDLASE
jgi:ABC-2 type transport system permease protein